MVMVPLGVLFFVARVRSSGGKYPLAVSGNQRVTPKVDIPSCHGRIRVNTSAVERKATEQVARRQGLEGSGGVVATLPPEGAYRHGYVKARRGEGPLGRGPVNGANTYGKSGSKGQWKRGI